MTDPSPPRLLIEDWLPVAELGIESQREREIPSALPPINFLHVWWARRPLVASAGVIVCSLLPAWTPELAMVFAESLDLESPERYREFVLRLVGIHGDPVAARRELDRLDALNVRKRPKQFEVFGYRRAYTNLPWAHDIRLFHQLLAYRWGPDTPSVLDPTAGGGSIPFAAARLGLPAIANDLNGVAAAILRGGVATPMRYGADLLADLDAWGTVLTDRVLQRLDGLFRRDDADERVVGYIVARTVRCRQTGHLVPLVPNWWLSNDKDKPLKTHRAVRARFDQATGEITFEILAGQAAKDSEPSNGLVRGGEALSPWGDRLLIDDDYIKDEAAALRMGHMLYAVAVRLPDGRFKNGQVRWRRDFRAPTTTDLAALEFAQGLLRETEGKWRADGVLPTDPFPSGNDNRPLEYGMTEWAEMYSPRQRFSHGVFVEEYHRLVPELQAAVSDPEQASAVLGLLGLMHGAALNYNSLLSSWHNYRAVVRSVFERHDFSFKWTYAEWDGAELFPWALGQLLDSYEKICSLLAVDRGKTMRRGGAEVIDNVGAEVPPLPAAVEVYRGSGGDLAQVAAGSQALICIDPPYYDNVMYGELSDYFGAWEQHTIGMVWPDLLESGIADKKNEAVANKARFADFGRRRKEMADQDYEAKMQSIFAECRRVLRDDGAMTVMFTHKRSDAWDTLGMALLEAGFEIGSSWPVRTESDKSLHQAKTNSAESTIMLFCRKRPAEPAEGPTFFDDIEGDVRMAARSAAKNFEAAGIDGVDLLLATYGPALAVLSRAWPVLSSETDDDGRSRLLRPEEALGAAREEVVRLRKAELVGRDVAFDGITDFVLIAWQTFRAEEFPYDEARRLALAIGGGDVETLAAAKVLEKKAGSVRLLSPKERRRKVYRRVVDGEVAGIPMVDVLHAVMVEASESSLGAAKALCDRLRLLDDQRFVDLIQAMVRAIPNTKVKGRWVRSEAEVLHQFCTAYLPQVELPEDPASDTLFELG
jgi:adenine-specific DNA methylase